MSKSAIDLSSLNIDQLQNISIDAQKLIEEKQHQRLFDAYRQFEQIAKDCDVSVDDILQAGKKLNEKRSIKYQNPENPKQTWTGRGRKPSWLVEALDNGHQLEAFAVS